MAQETFRRAVPPYHRPLPQPLGSDPLRKLDLFKNCNISYGLPFSQACAKHAEEMFHAKRIFVISSSTLARSTSALKDLESALGQNFAGVKFGLKAHTYLDEIIAIAAECRTLEVDLIGTLGGGSLSDAAKMVSLASPALANDVTQSADFLKLPTSRTAAVLPPAKAPTVPVVCVATTLSGGEFTSVAGATDERDNKKHQFIVGCAIQLVIFDAKFVTDCTPLNLLLQSGVRAIDHCVEGMCSLMCNEVTEMHAKMGLEQLVPALLRCKADGDAKTDVEARHLCQMAAVNAVAAFRVYTPCGASHAIGHMLGPFGVGHGETSSILLPAVCKYNALHRANLERQALVVAFLWGVPEMRRLAESKGLEEGIADLGDLLDVLFRVLDMPRTLKVVGVGRDKLDQLAEYSLLDTWSATNPVPLTEKAQVMEILEMVAG
ncbi:putative Fe-containing alcohol dehydrogenase [Mycena rosella]|uniref:Fe-containing alcohol dehydrogenase n=1 Tax=Mycena rosella TaxID=1033263 RepID=A0AAD7DC32_MYCRO|nr:putative Fe-containing alcohol dehydrogenase [Mycena rosella]